MVTTSIGNVRVQILPWARRGVRVSYVSVFASHKKTVKRYESRMGFGFETIVIQNVKDNEVEFHRVICLEDMVVKDMVFKAFLTDDGPSWIAMGKLDNARVGQKIILSKREFTMLLRLQLSR